MAQPRRLFFLTAARSEYDILAPVIRAAAATPGLRAEVVAAGAHLSPFHGSTIDEIKADGFPIAGCVESLLSAESWSARALSFAQLAEGLTRLLAANRPDILVIAGDREEVLAGAIVASLLKVHIAHLFGGDRSVATDIDEVLRAATSKLAHLHFTATEAHRQRLIRMGELPDRVWTVGATGLDRLAGESDVPKDALDARFGVDTGQPFFLLIHHPTPMLEATDSVREIAETLDGMLALGCPVFCSYPNQDPGNVAIRREIDRVGQRDRRLIVYHNLPRSVFVSLYRRCAAIVGNSSSIVIESGFLKVPGILVGPRQDLREVGPNVLRVEPEARAIAAACRRALEDATFRAQVRICPSIYGDGCAAPRIAQILASVPLSPSDLIKTMPY